MEIGTVVMEVLKVPYIFAKSQTTDRKMRAEFALKQLVIKIHQN